MQNPPAGTKKCPSAQIAVNFSDLIHGLHAPFLLVWRMTGRLYWKYFVCFLRIQEARSGEYINGIWCTERTSRMQVLLRIGRKSSIIALAREVRTCYVSQFVMMRTVQLQHIKKLQKPVCGNVAVQAKSLPILPGTICFTTSLKMIFSLI